MISMSNIEEYPKCHMRTSLGNCDPIGGFCTSVNPFICEALHKVAEPKTEWIPIKWHEITEEERDREGYPKDWAVHIDCKMPCDGQEIIVQTKSGCIRWDVCYEEGEFSLDSGWDWIEDIVAWQPLPEPYRREY